LDFAQNNYAWNAAWTAFVEEDGAMDALCEDARFSTSIGKY